MRNRSNKTGKWAVPALLLAGVVAKAGACQVGDPFNPSLPAQSSYYLGEVDWVGSSGWTPSLGFSGNDSPCTITATASGAATVWYPVGTATVTGFGGAFAGYTIGPNPLASPRPAAVTILGVQFRWTQKGNPDAILEPWIRSYFSAEEVSLTCLDQFAAAHQAAIDAAFQTALTSSYSFWQRAGSYLYGLLSRSPTGPRTFRQRVPVCAGPRGIVPDKAPLGRREASLPGATSSAGDVDFTGIELTESPHDWTGDRVSFQAVLPQPEVYFGFAWQNTGDGDFLSVAINGERIWSALGTDFEPGHFYFGRIPSALLAGKTGSLLFTLHGYGAPNARVAIADMSTVAFSPATPPDSTPPLTTAIASPPPGGLGWNNSPVAVSLTASDEGGSGVKLIRYTLAGAQTGSAEVPGPVASTTVSAEGTTTLDFYAIDQANNQEAPKSLTLKIDRTPPGITYSGNQSPYAVDQAVDIACQAADALSGIASSSCQPIQGPAYTFHLGWNTFTANATDRAGNQASASTTFSVAVTYSGLCNLGRTFTSAPGIANSWCAKLLAAEDATRRGNLTAAAGLRQAYLNEVAAQSGKALTAAQASTLARLAAALP